MSEYHKKLKQEIRQLQLDTIALRKIRAEMEEELEGELTFNIDIKLEDYDPIVQMDAHQTMVDAHIEEMAETNNWRN